MLKRIKGRLGIGWEELARMLALMLLAENLFLSRGRGRDNNAGR